MVMGARLEDFERPRRQARFQRMCGKSARRNCHETVHRAYEKPAIHKAMLGFTVLDRNWLAMPVQTREVAAP